MMTRKITVYVSTDKIGSGCNTEIEVDAKEWEEADSKERDEICKEAMFDMIEWGYEPSEEFEPNSYNS